MEATDKVQEPPKMDKAEPPKLEKKAERKDKAMSPQKLLSMGILAIIQRLMICMIILITQKKNMRRLKVRLLQLKEILLI